jgi:ABC-2 type transport system permease protein
VSAVIIGLSYSASSAIASSRDVHLSVDEIDAGLAPFFGLAILTALLGLLGLAIGLLVRHAAAAVSILILWPLLVENLVAGLLHVAGVEHPAKLLPYISGFQLASTDSSGGDDVLGRVAGGLYFGAVVLALLGVGAALTVRRDA